MFIVLMGPPGAGKTHIGHRLRDALGYSFRETERQFLRRYESKEAFVDHKASALAEMERELRERERSESLPVVIESSGLSDRPMIERLQAERSLLLVKICPPRDVCVERVRKRPPGANLNNDPEYAASFHDHWVRDIEPSYEFDLEVANDGATDAEIVGAVHEAVAR